MRHVRSIVIPMFAACAAMAAAACDRRVNLGAIGDGGASVLWRATFEPGDLSEWMGDGNGGTRVENAPAAPFVTTDIAHNGSHAGVATVAPAMGMPSLSYLFRQEPSPPEAYYSAWFYLPASLVAPAWLSLHHFRSSSGAQSNDLVAIWDINLYSLPGGGGLAAQLFDYATQFNLQQPNPVPVPTASWVHFEVLLRKAADPSGRIAVWQDGVLILNRSGVVTARSPWIQWEAGAASGEVSPSPAEIYVDDAAISLTRLGPSGG
jgi:hypothetical protein